MSSLEEPCYPRFRRKAGEVDFRCVNCDRALHRTIWEEATEWDVETGEVTEYGLEIALATCGCGAVNLVGFQPDGSGAVYWLNEREMRARLILYHGTGALRVQSIRRRGILPKPGSYVYATPDLQIAQVFATARGELEDQWGLVVKFVADYLPWETDNLFPHSLRCSKPVFPHRILSVDVLEPSEEIKASEWMGKLVATIKLDVRT